MMKISIITVVFNAKDTIKSTIESVINQTYNNIEYLIIDNKSTDGTLDIIQNYKNKIAKIISEKDDGIYDAMNKGLKNATGEVIAFLNGDDLYLNNNVIKEIMEIFATTDTDSVYTDAIFVDRYNIDLIKRYWKTGTYKKEKFLTGFQIPHPAFFCKKSIFDRYGAFDLNLKISADFELILRFLYKHNIKTFYLNKPIVKIRTGGISNKNLKNIILGNINCIKAFIKNGIPVSPLYPIFRLKEKLKQFIF